MALDLFGELGPVGISLVCSPQRHDKCPWISLSLRHYVRGSAEMMMPSITQCTSAGTVASQNQRQVIILLRAPGKGKTMWNYFGSAMLSSAV